LASCPGGDTFLDGSGAETTAITADEDGFFVDGRHRRTFRQPRSQGLTGFSTNGQYPNLIAFASDSHSAIGQIEIMQIESQQLGETQPRRIKEFHDGAISFGERIVADDLQQTTHLISVDGSR